MRGIRTRMTCLALALGLAAGLSACGRAASGGTVTVLVPWAANTAEYDAFIAVIKQFEHDTGIQVDPESTRALTQQLDADLNAKDPPDIADLPSPSAVDEYQHQAYSPAGVSLSSYDAPWRTLVEAAGQVLAVPVKADVKSLLWYRTTTVTHPPANWADLENLSKQGTPWCLGLSSGPTSGWPGADWIADILLSTDQANAYKNWLSGTLSWTSLQVQAAWQQWGKLMRDSAAVPGGPSGALTTSFGSATRDHCQLEHGALSATGINSTSTSDYSYVRLPSSSGVKSPPIMVSGDFMAQFTNNPDASKLLAYLTTAPAQRLWVSQPGGYAFSADGAVGPASYPSGVRQQLAALLQPGSGITLCFTAADMMVPDMSAAFYQAVLDYVNDPGSLTSLLRGLQTTERGAGPSPDSNRACATP